MAHEVMEKRMKNKACTEKTAAQRFADGDYLKKGEIAELLGCSVSTVDKLPLPCIQIGGIKRYDSKDLRQLIDRSKRQS